MCVYKNWIFINIWLFLVIKRKIILIFVLLESFEFVIFLDNEWGLGYRGEICKYIEYLCDSFKGWGSGWILKFIYMC